MKVKMLACVQACGRILDAGQVVCLEDLAAGRLISAGQAEPVDAFDAVAPAPAQDEPKKKRAKK